MIVEELKDTAKRISPHAVGAFIRDQREQAQVSLRQLAELAGVSNPYLSQIERGLRKPSAEILQQIAKGLRISAEQLYLQAGILEARDGDAGTIAAIMADSGISERQKTVLVEIYESFRRENAGEGSPVAQPVVTSTTPAAVHKSPARKPPHRKTPNRKTPNRKSSDPKSSDPKTSGPKTSNPRS